MKIFKGICLSVICAFTLFWLASLAMCEYNTYKYADMFKSVKIHDIGGEGYLNDGKLKVLKYTADSAEIYYVFTGDLNSSGNIYHFKSDEMNQWIFDGYETVWSKTGSADGFIWPYIR